MPDATPLPEPEYWVMHFDGSKLLNGSGAGVLLQSPTGDKLHYVLQIHFAATNNMAEYEALSHGLHMVKDIGIKRIVCCGDSDLVSQHVAGTWNARNPMMAAYRDEVEEIAKSFLGYESSMYLGSKRILPGVFLEHLRAPSVKGANIDNPERVDSF